MSVESVPSQTLDSGLPQEVGELLFASLPEALFIRESDGRISRRNAAALKFGMSLDGLLLEAVQKDGAPAIETSSDGTWLEITATPLREGYLIRVRDITAFRSMEEAIRRRDERARVIVKSTNDILWWADPQYGFVERQEAWEEFTGQTFDVYRNWGHVQAIHPEDRQRVQTAWNEATLERRVCTCEYRVFCPAKDEYRHCMAKGVPILDDAGEIREWVGTLTDIHDLKSAQAKLAQLNGELEARVAERTEALNAALQDLESLTYTCSHDVRTHLRGTVANVRWLQELCVDLGGEASETLDSIEWNALQVSQLIDDLLSFLVLKRRILDPAYVDVSELARELIGMKPQPANINFVVEDKMTLHADLGLIRAMLRELLDNATKYSPSGGTITVGMRHGPAKILYVRDEGIGFEDRYLPKLVLPFERLHGSREIPGTGIGLAKVDWIVKAHGGDLNAMAAPGKGSTFEISFPETRR